MIDTSPDRDGPRALVRRLTEARIEQRRLKARLALATSASERLYIRELMREQALLADDLERQRTDSPAFERR